MTNLFGAPGCRCRASGAAAARVHHLRQPRALQLHVCTSAR